MVLLSVMIMYILLLISPGPDFLFISQLAMSQSKRKAILGVLGITGGMAIWGILSLLGLQVLLLKFPWIERTIMILGGIYLCYMGFLLFRSFLKEMKQLRQKKTIKKSSKEEKSPFLKGILTNLSNPKVAICFASLFSIFFAQKSHMTVVALILMILLTFTWFAFVAWIFSTSFMQKKYFQASKWIDFLAFMIFTLFGLHLIFFI